jgi:hypothetical protein
MAASPRSVTTTIPRERFARPVAHRGLSSTLRNLLTAIENGFAGTRQAVERMNRLIDEAHLDHPDQ